MLVCMYCIHTENNLDCTTFILREIISESSSEFKGRLADVFLLRFFKASKVWRSNNKKLNARRVLFQSNNFIIISVISSISIFRSISISSSSLAVVGVVRRHASPAGGSRRAR